MKGWIFLLVMFTALGVWFGMAWEKQKQKALDDPRKSAAMAPGGKGAAGGPAAPGGRGGPGGGGRMASVELQPVSTRDIINTFVATGSVESMQNVKISPKISGRITYLRVREGDRVRTGQKLVCIDASDVQANVRQQQAGLAEARYRLAQAQLNQTPTDTALASQIRQQEANLTSAAADLTQAEKTRAAQLESFKASLDDAQAKIDTASAAVANANAGIKSAQANLDNATAKYTRIFGLYKQGYVAAQDVDDAKTTVSVQQSAVETAKGQLQAATAALNSASAQKRSVEQQTNITRAKADADVESARAKLTQARASLDTAQANSKQSPAYQQNLEALRAGVAIAQASLDSARAKLADAVLTAPLDGVVTARSQDPGAMASPSQPILTVQSLNDIWVTIAVPEVVCPKVHLGQPADATFDALGGQTFTGRIAQINPSADLQSRQFTVRVALNNRAHRFAPGMFARVSIITDAARGTLAVPQEAVELDKDGSRYVMVTQKGAKGLTVAKRPITVSAEDADWVGIAHGVATGEQVVTMSASPLKDGQAIRASSGRRGKGSRGQGAPGADAAGGAPGAPRGGQERPAGGARANETLGAPTATDAPASGHHRPAAAGATPPTGGQHRPSTGTGTPDTTPAAHHRQGQ